MIDILWFTIVGWLWFAYNYGVIIVIIVNNEVTLVNLWVLSTPMVFFDYLIIIIIVNQDNVAKSAS